MGRSERPALRLIDVLPDEASLAMMLAHELAHMVLGHPVIDAKLAFSDRLLVADGKRLQTVRFHVRGAAGVGPRESAVRGHPVDALHQIL